MNKRLIWDDEQQKERINEDLLKASSELIFSRITLLCDWMQLFFLCRLRFFLCNVPGNRDEQQ